MSSESSVRVAIRIRPLIPRETIDMCRCCTSVSEDAPQVWLGSDKAFTYDHVFDRDSLQHTVYKDSVSSLVDGCLRGLNATVLAYGQTGSGKTYTMGTGFDVEASPVSLGIIPRAVDHLFAGADQLKQRARDQGHSEPEFTVTAQFMELYNEEIIDLLDTSKVNGDHRSSIRIQEDGDGGISAAGVTSHPVASGDDCLRALRAGALSRTTASTQMNTQSSRSHAIFSLIIRQKRVIIVEQSTSTDADPVPECGDSSTTSFHTESRAEQPPPHSSKLDFELLSAKLHFVDLAGSERLKRTGATGQRAKEGISINCGLLALGNVISALGDESRRASHVPYRDSKLTRLLQDSLGGNSQTLMIACISPSDADFMETLNTLKYANRARNIKNRVTVNQDKGSRMVAVLRAEIQQLKLELLEYKQGKRVIGADGSEAVNDMHHENSMLSEDNCNLRTRIKAMQGTIEELTARTINLQSQSAMARWKTADEEGGVDQMVAGYLGEIEELRAKLLESQNMCQQLRRLMTARAPGVPPAGPFNNVGLTSVELSPGSTTTLIAEARQQLARDQLARAERQQETSAAGDSSDSDPDLSAKDTGNDSDVEESTDEHEADDKECGNYTEELAQLTADMSLKQRLIDELERSQRKLEVMRAQYEQKLEQLATRIRSTEEERDKVLASIRNQASASSDEVKKVTGEYERKLSEMTGEMRKLQTAKREHSKLLKSQTQYEKQIRALKDEVVNMKKAKVNLMNKMKQDVNRVKKMDLQHHKLVSQLRKECRKHENQIKSLENERNVRDLVLKRKQQEIAVLRKNHSSNSAGRAKQKGKVAATPASCKRVWHALEKSISQLALNKQTVSNMEREMERKLKERESLRRKLARVSLTRSRAASRGADETQLRELDDVTENIQDNISYVNDMINECQESIITIEESKETMTVQEPTSLVRDLSVPETQYLLEKLISLSVHQSCLAAQHEISSKEAHQRINQISENSGMQQQLLRHLMTAEGGVDPTVASMISGVASTVYVSGARDADFSPESDEELADVTPPWSTAVAPRAEKARSRVATASELLIPPPATTTTTAGDWRADSPAPLPHPASVLPTQQSYAAALANPLPLRRSLSNVVAVPSSRQSTRNQLRTSPLATRRALRPSLSNQMTQSSYTTSDLNRPVSDGQTEVSPLPSPLSLRRQASGRGSNVFSRLTWSSSAQRDTESRVGVINARQTRAAARAPLVCTHVAEGHSKAVLSVCCTNDTLFSGSKDRTVKVWDLVTGRQVHSLEGHPNNVVSVRYSEQARLVFSVSSAFVRVWDLRQGNAKCIKTLSSSGLTSSSVPISTPSRTLQMPAGESQVTAIDLSDTGRVIYTAAHSTVRVWDLRRFVSCGKLSGGHQAAVMCLSVRRRAADSGSPAGDFVFTGSKDHYVKAFSVADGVSGLVSPCLSVEPPHYDGVQSVVAAADRLYSGSRDACIKVWRLTECETGASARASLIHSVNGAHRDWVCGMCLTKGPPPGALMSVCRSGYVRLWSTDSCRSMGEVRAHSAAINDITANSTHAFTASNDHTVGLWKIRALTDSDSGDTS